MSFTRIGLTGGIATGKSSVAELWRAHGATVIDSDLLAHRALEPATATYREIVQTFGPAIVNADRTINRRQLGEIVFADAARRQELNAIVHPIVRAEWQRGLAAATGIAVVGIPLLFEVGAEKEFDCVVVVGCSETTQLARLAVNGLTEAQARARIRAQLPLPVKMDRGDFVIWNDGSRAVLHRQAEIIWTKIKES
ncbi:MAG: dephospho-CoA kinase [Verrucomicrobiota bacterium]|jgi:dephospho-CoA kinase